MEHIDYVYSLPPSYYTTIMLRIIAAAVIGGIVGFEREYKNRPAGFRTHILVCVSACSLMILSDILFDKYYTLYDIAIDPQRLAAQVISGIGFLGAGTIIHFGNSVRGLTTAASIWGVAALGLITGSGFFFLAFFTLLTIELVLFTFDNFIKVAMFKNKTLDLFLTINHTSEVVGQITMYLGENNLDIAEFNFKDLSPHNPDVFMSKIKVVLHTKNCDLPNQTIINELEKIEGVISVQH